MKNEKDFEFELFMHINRGFVKKCAYRKEIPS